MPNTKKSSDRVARPSQSKRAKKPAIDKPGGKGTGKALRSIKPYNSGQVRKKAKKATKASKKPTTKRRTRGPDKGPRRRAVKQTNETRLKTAYRILESQGNHALGLLKTPLTDSQIRAGGIYLSYNLAQLKSIELKGDAEKPVNVVINKFFS